MLSLALALALSADAPAVDLPALLRRLAAEDARADDAQANRDHTERVRFEEVDRQGHVEHVHLKELRVTYPGGKEHDQIVSASEDGKDTTAEARTEKAKEHEEHELLNPFSAKAQPRYRYTLLGADPAHPGHVLVHFEPIKPADELAVGDAEVDPVSARALFFRGKPSSMPFFVHRADLTVSFAHPEGLLTQITIDAEGGFLFLTKHIRVAIDYSDYAPPPAAAAK